MSDSRKGTYLINRMRTLTILSILGFAVLLILLFLLLPRAGLSPALALIGVVPAAVWLFVWIRLVVRPLRRRETEISQMLRGYGDPEMYQLVPIDREDEMLFQQVKVWLNPSRAFQMNKRQVQYLALQNQINPHFLYNTLESIRSEALLSGLSSVADMTEALANFFRYTISKTENLVTVEEELHNCETYFHIQQYRFGDRLEMSILCDEEDRDELYHCRIPKLTLQPILENSIIHGTELKMGVGHLVIQLSRSERRMLLQVSDDGVGMDEETLNRLNSRLGRGGFSAQMEDGNHGGLALVNVDNRIRLIFGEEYGLHVFSMPNVGTTVEITLPVITNEQDVPNREAL